MKQKVQIAVLLNVVKDVHKGRNIDVPDRCQRSSDISDQAPARSPLDCANLRLAVISRPLKGMKKRRLPRNGESSRIGLSH